MNIEQIDKSIIFRDGNEYFKFPEGVLNIYITPIEELDDINKYSYTFVRKTRFNIDVSGQIIEMNGISSYTKLNEFEKMVNDLIKLDELYFDKARCYQNKEGLISHHNEYKYWDKKEEKINEEIYQILLNSDICVANLDLWMYSLDKVYFKFKNMQEVG